MELTREQAVAEHRNLWRWIANETRSRKRRVEKYEYFKNFEIPKWEIPRNSCYCCEYSFQLYIFQFHSLNCCENCPIDWGYSAKNNMCCDDTWNFDGIYFAWCYEEDWQKAADLAERIANLPERKN